MVAGIPVSRSFSLLALAFSFDADKNAGKLLKFNIYLLAYIEILILVSRKNEEQEQFFVCRTLKLISSELLKKTYL